MPSSDRSLLTVILDVTPSTWAERDLKRTASDKARAAANKRSVGPARIEDCISSTIAFCLSFAALKRDNVVVVVGVAGDEVAILYPRKGGSGRSNLGSVVNDPSETTGGKVDPAALDECVRLGVAELVARAAKKDEERAEQAEKVLAAAEPIAASASGDGGDANISTALTPPAPGAAIASAVTVALCVINRFLVAAGRGVSALADRPNASTQSSQEEEGIMALVTGNTSKKSKSKKGRGRTGVISPRILIIQATEDRTGDYNAFMNGTFAALKGQIVLDGCFIPSGISGRPKQSAYLEQACDRTGGIFLAPSGAAQVGGALTEVLVSVFLSPVSVRKRLNLPTLAEVDFRPLCFETGDTVDIAHVCNQCLSIFKNLPLDSCPTCGAAIAKKSPRSGSSKKKRAKHS